MGSAVGSSRGSSVRWRVWLAAGFVCAALGGAHPVTADEKFRGGVLEPAHPAPDFALTASDGSTFRLHEQRGRVVVLFFGYTFCPDVCPLTLSQMVQVRSQLGAGAARMRVAFITVDPERDTVARLRTYVGAFDRSFLGLTGDSDAMARVRQAYGVVAEKHAVAGTKAAYLIDHSAFVYVVDPDGRLRLMFPFGMSIDDMAHDIGLLLGG
jgi:protein SCO1/2